MEKITCVHFLNVREKLSGDAVRADEFTNKLKELIEEESLHPDKVQHR